MLLEPVCNNVQPPFRSALKNEILRFANAHPRMQKPYSKLEPEDFEKLKESAAFSAARLKNQPFHISTDLISQIAANPEPWIDEIYDAL